MPCISPLFIKGSQILEFTQSLYAWEQRVICEDLNVITTKSILQLESKLKY